jgi:hypothetical protein
MGNALDIQVGGNHYKEVKIQPVQFAEHNDLSFCEGNVIKYIVRSRKKNGLQDMQKAGHYLQLLAQLTAIRQTIYTIKKQNIQTEEFLAQFPELTPEEKDVVRFVTEWRLEQPDFTYEYLLLQLEDLALNFHNVINAWSNSSLAGAN